MGNELSRVIDELLAGEKEKAKPIRFSVQFSKFELKRIEYVAEKLNISRVELIRRLSMAGVVELEEKLGLISPPEEGEVYDYKKDELIQVSDLRRFINQEYHDYLFAGEEGWELMKEIMRENGQMDIPEDSELMQKAVAERPEFFDEETIKKYSKK